MFLAASASGRELLVLGQELYNTTVSAMTSLVNSNRPVLVVDINLSHFNHAGVQTLIDHQLSPDTKHFVTTLKHSVPRRAQS